MNVLVFADEYPPSGGGAGSIAAQIVDDFYSLSNYDVPLITADDCNTETKAQTNAKVKRYTLVWVFNYLLMIFKNIKLGSFNKIILNEPVAAYIASFFFPKTILKKSVYIVHGDDAEFFFQRKNFKFYLFAFPLVYSRLIRHIGKIVCISNNGRERFIHGLPRTLQDISDKKTFVKYAGINPLHFKDINEIEKNKGLEKIIHERKVLISVGRIIKGKGYLAMVDNFLLARETFPDLIWLVIGQGEFESELKKVVSHKKLSNSVIFVGKIARQQLSYYFSLSDIFWLLSPIESLPLVYIEAGLFGLPSIGVKQLGSGEIIKEGVNGYHLANNGDIVDIIHECLALKKDKNKIITYSSSFSTEEFAHYLVDYNEQ